MKIYVSFWYYVIDSGRGSSRSHWVRAVLLNHCAIQFLNRESYIKVSIEFLLYGGYIKRSSIWQFFFCFYLQLELHCSLSLYVFFFYKKRLSFWEFQSILYYIFKQLVNHFSVDSFALGYSLGQRVQHLSVLLLFLFLYKQLVNHFSVESFALGICLGRRVLLS